MNYIDKIKNSMRPKLNEVLINEIPFWVHRPTMQDLANCTSLQSTIILCVKDENGDPIFSDTDIDGRVNVTTMDFQFAQDLYKEVLKLTNTDSVDEIEKK